MKTPVTDAVFALMELGVSGEALRAALERIEAAAYESRFDMEEAVAIATAREDIRHLSKGAERTRRYRERKASQGVTVTSQASPDVTSVTETSPSPTPPSTPHTPPFTPLKGGVSLPAPPSPKAKATGFDSFWAAYPSKVGKRAAEEAYRRAVKRANGDDPDAVILAGVERAKRSKRWREGFVANPATWLNQDRWLDEPEGQFRPAPSAPAAPPSPELQARRLRHLRDTGEWKDGWGPRPDANDRSAA